ncbi:MAG TPA: hypothetical protein VK638_34870 [Edaphobacter sp.]|nr:hypothetical protein [Edaphobacter sp.]
MTTKIDELSTRYLIPGIDMGTAAVADPDGVEDDYADAPYSQMPAVTDMPTSTGWQDLLGLNQISPSPSQIDPPPRPTYSEWGTPANATVASFHFPGTDARNGLGEASTSPKVERMIGLLAGYSQAARLIRARASRG